MASCESDQYSGFHQKCGQLVVLSHSNKTASRSHANQEFNHGLILSNAPLQNDSIFEVRIDKKINSWSGSVEVGVVSCDPDDIEVPLPLSATELRMGAWILSGSSILKDGRSIQENYGSTDLDELEENDRVGVLKTADGELVFFVNGVSQGVAATGLPEKVWAVVDLYGKCAQVTLMDECTTQEARIRFNDQSNEATAAASNKNFVNLISSGNSIHHNITNSNIAAMTCADSVESVINVPEFCGSAAALSQSCSSSSLACNKLRFHDKRGKMVKLSNNHRTAERRRPCDEFNHGVVMTHRNLEDDELFEVRIDRLVEKWSGSIEVGVTTHNPDILEFPATMTNIRSGTVMMTGSGIVTNGKGTRHQYGHFNLDELQEGDRIGLMRKSSGDLHFYVNGLDQGVAATRIPSLIWGAVDLYGMTVKVTIVDRDERDEQNLITRRAVGMREMAVDENKLSFHTNCGSHAAVMNGGMTAHRPNATDDFNFGVVLTNRPLKINEVFEVRLDKMVSKWAGSIEIGVTTHSPNELEFPSTMTNIRSGTWMMTGTGVMHNGTTIIEDYGINLDKLKVGDRVAVVRKENGTIHFYVNSEDQGPAATKVPERVFGVIDLYGQAAQATIIDVSEFRTTAEESDIMQLSATPMSASGYLDIGDLLRFHHLHGRNARISNNGLTASRPNSLGEFNDAIVMSNRSLRDGEVFEIVIERTVDRWSGSIEAGVTLIRPEDLQFPNTMTDIDYATWMLSGSSVMRDGRTVRNGYCCDLDTLGVGSRLGMVRHADGTLHYLINGEDQGVACENIPPGVFAVIDLYGQCCAVSLVGPTSQSACSMVVPQTQHSQENNSVTSSQIMVSSNASLPNLGPVVATASEITVHTFMGPSRTVEVFNRNTVCKRKPHCITALAYASHSFDSCDSEETFEVRLEEMDAKLSGSLRIGLTGQPPCLGADALNQSIHLQIPTIWLEGTCVKQNTGKQRGVVVRHSYCQSLDRLRCGDRLGLKFRSVDGSIKFLVNGEDCGVAVTLEMVPAKLHPFVELFGSTVSVACISSCQPELCPGEIHDSVVIDDVTTSKKRDVSNKETNLTDNHFTFHENRGRNIQFRNGCRVAIRADSYNQGIVLSNRPLAQKEIFSFKILKTDPKWSSSVMVGLIAQPPEKINLPLSAVMMKKGAIIVSGNSVFQNGVKICGPYGPNLDLLPAGTEIGVAAVDGYLHLYVNGIDQGPASALSKSRCPYYAVIDLYGQCAEVSLDEKSVSEKSDSIPIPSSDKLDTNLIRSISNRQSNSCEYLNLCRSFKTSLSLPAAFFATPQDVACYCVVCCKRRGEEVVKKKGDPAREYSVPQGWVRFGLRASSKPSWHLAYHATKLTYLRKILDCGQLLPSGELGLEQRSSKLKSKEDGSDSQQLLFSPCLNYASVTSGISPIKFRDKKTERIYLAHLALQLDVHPGSYKVGPPSELASQPGAHLKDDEIEWLTKERGNTILTGLLVRLQSIS